MHCNICTSERLAINYTIDMVEKLMHDIETTILCMTHVADPKKDSRIRQLTFVYI